MKNALNTANQEIIGSQNQDISIGTYGIKGRRKLSNGTFDNRQLMITNNLICMTDDNWQTSKVAIGEVKNSNGSGTTYGILADLITGKILAGNQLSITNENNSFTSGRAGVDSIYATHAYIDNLYVQKSGTFAGKCKWTYNDSGTYKTSTIRQARGHLILEANDALEIVCPNNSGVIIRGNTAIVGNTVIFGKFMVADGFSKNCIQKTEHYGNRLINAYEIAEYYYGDIVESEVKNGICKVEIEPIFSECVNLKIGYQVFLSPYGEGNIFVSERTEKYFIVKGDNIPFCYEIKAKRRGFENTRLEQYK